MKRPGGQTVQRLPSSARARAIALVLVSILMTATLSGCLVVDFFTPRPAEEGEDLSGKGAVRIWAAARPGSLGNEFVHYNVTFGLIAQARDLLLNDLRVVESTFATVDLVRLEREGQSVLLGQAVRDPSGYAGIAYGATGASLATERIVGNDDGQPVVEIDEQPIKVNSDPVRLRAAHNVERGIITDLFIEIDVVRSLQRDEDGTFRHVPYPFGVAVYGNGAKADHFRYDGVDPSKPNGGGGSGDFAAYGASWGDPKLKPPVAIIELWEDDPDRSFYKSDRHRSRTLLRAVGLGETLHYDGIESYSNTLGATGQLAIVEYTWDFGDGTRIRSSTPLAEHAYTEGGIYDIVLQVRDEKDLIDQEHTTLFVPYHPDQAERIERDARAGTILIGSQVGNTETGADAIDHTFSFPPDQDDGTYLLGGYRITTRYSDPTGGIVDANVMRMTTKSGQLDHTTEGTGTLQVATGGVPFWRGPLRHWVEPEITVELELKTGALVDYDVEVEGLYYHNASRGADPHLEHAHGEWRFGPGFVHLNHDGTRNCRVHPSTGDPLPEEQQNCPDSED